LPLQAGTRGTLPIQKLYKEVVRVARIFLSLPFAALCLGAQTTGQQAFEWQERWDNYLERTYSWKRISAIGVETAFGQTFQLNRCGRPPYCFPHEFGAALVRRTARNSMELGAGALLREDIRRKPSGLTGVWRRVWFAVEHAPLARGPDGDWRPAYSRFAGTLGGIAVWSAWEGKPITTARLSERFGMSATTYFQDALFAEFQPDMKRFGERFFREHVRRHFR
jgi:hypothetical protein